MSEPLPVPVQTWPAMRAGEPHRGVGITIINFNTSMQTLRCLASLGASSEAPAWVLVLDNASRDEDFATLRQGCHALPFSELHLFRSETNLGFAAGSNFLIDQVLKEPSCRFVGLLNNDAVALPDMVVRLTDALAKSPARIGLVGGRMHRLHAPQEIDTLGISIYGSLMPADRRSIEDPFFGPTGGCCLMSRELIEQLAQVSGYCFDPSFFCYCEDTDLALRANLLGYEPAYVDELLALHEGQASSGGGYNQFIAYHGIRNTIWMHMKLMPASILWRNSAWLGLAHIMTIGRHMLAGHFRLLWSIYRDAWSRRHVLAAERRRFSRHSKLSAQLLARRFAPRFYRQGYFRLAVTQMLKRRY